MNYKVNDYFIKSDGLASMIKCIRVNGTIGMHGVSVQHIRRRGVKGIIKGVLEMIHLHRIN